MDNTQVKHRNLDFVLHLDELLLAVQIELHFPVLVELVVLFLKLGGLLSKLLCLFQQFQEGALSVVALAKLNL